MSCLDLTHSFTMILCKMKKDDKRTPDFRDTGVSRIQTGTIWDVNRFIFLKVSIHLYNILYHNRVDSRYYYNTDLFLNDSISILINYLHSILYRIV